MSDFESLLQKYSKLVDEWNNRYGDKCSAMPVSKDEFYESYTGCLKMLLSDEMSGQKKVSMTIKLMKSYENVSKHPRNDTGKLSRGELARLIIQSGKKVLSEA